MFFLPIGLSIKSRGNDPLYGCQVRHLQRKLQSLPSQGRALRIIITRQGSRHRDQKIPCKDRMVSYRLVNSHSPQPMPHTGLLLSPAWLISGCRSAAAGIISINPPGKRPSAPAPPQASTSPFSSDCRLHRVGEPRPDSAMSPQPFLVAFMVCARICI